ncbi:MAG: aminoacyl-tRNA hydrolase [Candidatus Portnoybacteria bacterium]|nr:aminoacyl-tRNA hydrolase [Candidatus Portnoybacteria bacterium]MDD4982616.1 aminoacyl-tRNA hydrolase [Candidatus Portnoybacteria bacterium]
MKLIIGLGNPGPQYFNTRHNFGFLAANFLQDSLPGFSDWQANEKFKAMISEGQIDGEKILLAKPQTFMNNSGQAAKLIADFYKLGPDDILLLHDDLDLPLGDIRVSQNSGAAGHKGVQSIIEKLGTKNFLRVRLGIKPAKQTFLAKFFKKFTPAEKFVLQKFSEEEKTLVQQATAKTEEAILLILEKGPAGAQNRFN